jgi:hypothetical protein
VSLSLVLAEEDTSGLANDVRSGLAPWDGSRVLLVEDLDPLAVDNKVLAVFFDSSLESAVDGVILKVVDEIVEWHEWVVDGSDLNLGVAEGSSENESSDSAEAVDTEFDKRHPWR